MYSDLAKKVLQRISKSEAMLINRISTFILNHPKCSTAEVTGYFSEFKPEVIKAVLEKMISTGYLTYHKLEDIKDKK